MFDKHFGGNRQTASKDRIRPFTDWFLGLASTSVRNQAKEVMAKAEEIVPSLVAWRTTPQGGQWHCEGPKLASHIERILVGVLGEGNLLEIEELVREKDLWLEIAELQETLEKYRDLLTVFACTHDAAKPATLAFDAPEGSPGAAAGFMVRRTEGMTPATEVEKVRYDKLYRAFVAQRESDEVQNMIDFYEEYQIAAHWPEHAGLAVTAEHTVMRQELLQNFGVPVANAKLLTELIRYHIEVIGSFTDKIDISKYEVMMARAGKAGLNVDVYLDLLVAVAYLDAVVGCVVEEKGKQKVQTQLLINMWRAEREACPERHSVRVRKAESVRKAQYKEALDKAGISGEQVFKLLNTPFGPERGVLMEQVWLAIRDKSHTVEVGEHTAELVRRIEVARELLTRYNEGV